MKTKALLLCIGICMSQLISYSQNNSTTKKKEYKFAKIAPEEFLIKATGQDSAAAAIKLFDIGDCYFEISPITGGFVYVFERHIRIKILTKNGYDLANFKIGLRRSNSTAKELLYSMDAATYNMIDGKMVISKPNKDAKFTEEFNKNYSYKKYALPNVKEGSIIEYKYKVVSDFWYDLRGWSFQSDIPILHTEYNVKIPEYLTYKTNFSGYLIPEKTIHENINASYVSGLASTAVYDQYMLDNVPALKDEPFITTLADYRPSIDFELQSTHFPNALVVDYNSNWKKIIAGLTADENFGSFINKNSFAKTTLPTILKGEKDSLAVTKLIFDYVKKNIKWNDETTFYASTTNPKSIFEKKLGNSADINLCLISLLKEAKIEVYPFLLSTRSNGMHPGYAVISKFDNVLAHVKIGSKNIILDATDKDLELGMISYENLNHDGLSINMVDQIATWISTEPSFINEKIFNLNLTLDKDNKFTGKLSSFAKGYAALNIRDSYRHAINETEYIKNLKKNKTGLELSNYKLDNLDNIDELLIESMDVVVEDNVEEAGNLVYFTPLLYERTKENIFKQEKRAFPVDFGYPFKESYRITITFPENYEIEKLPKSGTYQILNNNGSFSISFLTDGKTLMVKSLIDIKKSVYTPEEYLDLKELFKTVVEKQAEQVVFKKKS